MDSYQNNSIQAERLGAYFGLHQTPTEPPMTLCPIAIVNGCEKCPAFKICPLKGVIGDAKPGPDTKDSKPVAAPGKK
jgi:hypothetical protein